LHFTPGAVQIPELQIELGALALEVNGELDATEPRLSVALQRVSCQSALRSLPSQLVPRLDGLVLTGEIAAQLRLQLGSSHTLALDLDHDCAIVSEAPGT